MNLKKLAKLANRYDLKGEYAKADALDLFLKKASEEPDFFERITEKSLTQEEAYSLFYKLKEEITKLNWPKLSFYETLGEIKKKEGEFFQVFNSGLHLSLGLIISSLSSLDGCKDKPKDYLDILEKQLFPKFAEMIFSGLAAYQVSGYSDDKAFGHSFVPKLAEMKDDSELSSAFVDYILNQEAITTIINSMKPSPDSSTIRREDDPTGRKLYRELYEKGKPYAEGPESIYKIIEEKEDPFYEDE